MKTRFLTQDSARIDKISRQNKAILFLNSKTIVGIQESISPYSLNKISLSNTPWMRKLIYKRLEARDSRIVVSR